MTNLDAIHFSESLLENLNSLLVLDKCNHFVFQWQLLQFLRVLGLHRALLARGCCHYSLPLAYGELAWPGVSGTNLSDLNAERKELIVLACLYNL